MGFVIAISDQNNINSYISNTDPIIWTSKISEAKKYSAFEVTNILSDDSNIYSYTLRDILKNNKSIKDIFVIEVDNNNKVISIIKENYKGKIYT